MNKTAIAIGVIAVLIVGGIFFYYNRTTVLPSETTNTPLTQNAEETAQPTRPAVMTSSTAAPYDTTVVVTGSVVPNGAFTTYWYEYGSTSALSSQTSRQSIGSGYVAIPAPVYITGLAKSTTYYFRLVAENAYGRVDGAQYTFKTTTNSPAPQGSIPSTKTLAATGVTRTAANLGGEVDPNKGSTQYWFEYGKTENLGNTTSFQSVGNGDVPVSASAALSGLAPATTYYFRLNAQNQFGTVGGTILSFKTDGPAAATAPAVTTRAATAIGTSTATLRVMVDPNGAETKFWFEYSTDSLLGSLLVRVTPKTSAGAGTNPMSAEATVSGLSPNTTYHFRAVAENNGGLVQGEKMTFKTN